MKFDEYGFKVIPSAIKIKRLLCESFGHKWDESNKYRQPCKRCDRTRHLMHSWHKGMQGEKSISWQII